MNKQQIIQNCHQTNLDIGQRVLSATQSRTANGAHGRDEHVQVDSGQHKERPNHTLKVQEQRTGQTNHHVSNPETPFVVWPCIEKRRHEGCKASNNEEGGREDTSRKAHTEVDGKTAERFETTPTRSKPRT